MAPIPKYVQSVNFEDFDGFQFELLYSPNAILAAVMLAGALPIMPKDFTVIPYAREMRVLKTGKIIQLMLLGIQHLRPCRYNDTPTGDSIVQNKD